MADLPAGQTSEIAANGPAFGALGHSRLGFCSIWTESAPKEPEWTERAPLSEIRDWPAPAAGGAGTLGLAPATLTTRLQALIKSARSG